MSIRKNDLRRPFSFSLSENEYFKLLKAARAKHKTPSAYFQNIIKEIKL